MKKIKILNRFFCLVVKSTNNDQGFILAVVLLISLIMVFAVTTITLKSNTEMAIVRNEGLYTNDFYMAEGGLSAALINSSVWRDDAFSRAGVNDYRLVAISNYGEAVRIVNIDDSVSFYTPSGKPDAVRSATVGVRKMNNPKSEAAYDIPQLTSIHQEANASELVGIPLSGNSSAIDYDVVFFVLTSRNEAAAGTDAEDGNVVIQIGITETIPKGEEELP